jgi:hypothetical protein
MTEAELNGIEAALDIVLPSSYRDTMLEYPIPALVGNSDAYLWDDASRLIEENTLLRSGAPGGVQPWPQHFYCLGRAGGDDVYAIDLRTPNASVWWVDHSHLDIDSSGKTHDSFKEWLSEFVRDTIHDLECDGLAPDCSPEQRQSAHDESARQYGACLLWIIGIGLSLLALILALTWWLKRL